MSEDLHAECRREIERLRAELAKFAVPPTDDLQRFCGDSSRYSFDSPFVRSGFEYATGGGVLVRRPTDKPDSQDRKYPDVESYFENIPADSEFTPINPRELEDDCQQCVFGAVTCGECGHESMCLNCDGSGYETAWIGRYAFAPKYDNLVRSIPGVRVSSICDEKGLWFIADNLIGRVMGLASEETPDATRVRDTSEKEAERT